MICGGVENRRKRSKEVRVNLGLKKKGIWGYPLDERLMSYLELAKFGSMRLIQIFDSRYDLIFALVERWCPETYTFHLPRRECINTLEDVALQLELPIVRSAVMSVSTIFELATLFDNLLGVSPSDVESKFTGLRFSWLKASCKHLPINATDWGSVVLAMLYCKLFRMTKPSVVDIGECLILLQSWALYRMPLAFTSIHTMVLQYGETIFIWWAIDCSPLHMHRLGAYDYPLQHTPPTPLLEPSPELVPKFKLEPELEQSYAQSGDSSYHPDLGFDGFSRAR
ncbi:hypothetical protein J1N35_033954 [Gossypium stocksii]|uniref:Aminotransferase-like plant mobile domain-containing protein n=1 Tax=Gossypium stocksii TaxID=47602 RepID=A0A9D3US06_9ROSI|nr:hypothetical protein J1N35_033954 [Gossypium stocksii]